MIYYEPEHALPFAVRLMGCQTIRFRTLEEAEDFAHPVIAVPS